MSSHRLRSTLYHSVPKPPSRPPPLWQIATALDVAAVPTVAAASRPSTSAVPAGWTCVGIGLLTAWFFPLAHVFFSIAIILSIVAMATHQVRSGLALLAGSLASIGVCAILFICGVAVIAAAALHAAPKSRPELTSMTQPAPTTRLATPVVSGRGPVAAPSYTAPTATYTWEADPNATKPVAAPSYTAPTATVTYTPPAPTATPIDHAARDRQIGALQKRIDQLDETVRRVRADPHWYGIVPRSTDTARQQSSDAYLDQLDKQRNDLRRQKWALEGR